MNVKVIHIDNIALGADNPLVFIAGPCVIESRDAALRAAERLKSVSEALNIPLIFKSSYDKANRTSVDSFRGPGIDEGLKILEMVKSESGLPVISDIHSAEEAVKASKVLDVIQIPAFLCRQTDIIVAAANTRKPVNIKKGQFMAPADMKNSIDKVLSTGNKDVMITERGTLFGYNNLVVDMRGIPVMRQLGFPVIFDATHSVQLPGGQGSSSGGQREFAEPLARAAVSAGCDAVFMEVHETPETAPCDGPNMITMEEFEVIAERLVELSRLVRSW
ncbi:MAG: 2-dehydro-3-deoxyphosphooctonate aldolase [Nitrospira bacterium SG8_35_1]|nr:MAG: 2-dehydro-3-deoxyphosphooctonate aldolase [Nitrospira bacterium SG8_35_1]